jgi:CHORD
MKVLLHYEDNEDAALHKSLKITLPKSWKSGPASKLVGQFVDSYNKAFPANPLEEALLHLEIRQHNGEKSSMVEIASDAIVVETIPDRADLYVVQGAAKTRQDMEDERREEARTHQETLKDSVACTHYGCKNRFPKGGPYPECRYHKAPPVFHETAKFWSCCANKKAYDWDDFQNIPGCQTGICTEIKEENSKQFLGGTDLREKAGEAVKLKSIDDFNKAQAAGGSAAAPVLERLQLVLEEVGVEKELFHQVIDGIKLELGSATSSEAELFEAVKEEIGKKIKSTLKAVAAEQLRIK